MVWVGDFVSGAVNTVEDGASAVFHGVVGGQNRADARAQEEGYQRAQQEGNAARDKIYASQDRLQDEVSGGTDPAAIQARDNWDSWDHPAIKNMTENLDSGQMHGLSQAWSQSGSAVAADFSDFHSKVQQTITAGWKGEAAQAAQQNAATYAQQAEGFGHAVDFTGMKISEAATGAEQTRAMVPEPKDFSVREAVTSGILNPLAGANDVYQQKQAQAAAHAEAVNVMNTVYTPVYVQSDTGVPAFTPPTAMPGSDVGAGLGQSSIDLPSSPPPTPPSPVRIDEGWRHDPGRPDGIWRPPPDGRPGDGGRGDGPGSGDGGTSGPGASGPGAGGPGTGGSESGAAGVLGATGSPDAGGSTSGAPGDGPGAGPGGPGSAAGAGRFGPDGPGSGPGAGSGSGAGVTTSPGGGFGNVGAAGLGGDTDLAPNRYGAAAASLGPSGYGSGGGAGGSGAGGSGLGAIGYGGGEAGGAGYQGARFGPSGSGGYGSGGNGSGGNGSGGVGGGGATGPRSGAGPGAGQAGRGATSGIGSSAPASEAAAARGAGGQASGARGGAGMGGMGAGGGRGKGEDDYEHSTPSYLVTQEHGSEIVGELPMVSPPVIGE